MNNEHLIKDLLASDARIPTNAEHPFILSSSIPFPLYTQRVDRMARFGAPANLEEPDAMVLPA